MFLELNLKAVNFHHGRGDARQELKEPVSCHIWAHEAASVRLKYVQQN